MNRRILSVPWNGVSGGRYGGNVRLVRPEQEQGGVLMSRAISSFLLVGLSVTTVGCMVPRERLDECYGYNCQLQRRHQEVCAQYANLQRQNQELANKNLDLEDQLASQDKNVAQRLAEWSRERDELSKQAQVALGEVQSQLPRQTQYRLEDFAKRYPEFVEVDPRTGISKFKSDVLFESGNARLRSEALTALKEFANIFQDASGRSLMIAVVGHTDVTPIKRPETSARYESNWDLSTDRSNAVVKYLQQSGIEPNRMVSVGYGPYQPLANGRSPDSLARNRRVEVYVLAPDAPMVGKTNRTESY
jgi:chemotaxis protein MotB